MSAQLSTNVSTPETSQRSIIPKRKKTVSIEKKPGFFSLVKHGIIFILLPFIWFRRETGRFRGVIKNNDARPMSENEIYFISSWPIFLALLGSILGLILGLIGAVTNSKEFWDRVAQAGKPFTFIGSIIDYTYAILTFIFGLLFDIFVIINNILVDYTITSKNIAIPFTIDSLLLLVLFLVLLAFLETKIYIFISKYVHIFFNKLYNMFYVIFANLDRRIWSFLIYKIGKKVMGNKKLENYNILFFKKLIVATFIFSFIVFFGGIVIFIGQSDLYLFKDAITSILYLITVLFIAGIIAGFPVTYAYMRFLSNFSEYKYIIHRKKDDATSNTDSNK